MFLLLILPWFIVSAFCFMSLSFGYRGSSLSMVLILLPSLVSSFVILYITLFSGVILDSYFISVPYVCFWDFDICLCLGLSMCSSIWCFLLCVVSYCVHFYALWYMSNSPYLSKFLGTLSLFTGGMCLLLISDDIISLFIGWELIGIASYLLVSFSSTRSDAVRGGLKALIYNRIGDLGVLIGLSLGLSIYCDNSIHLWSFLDSLCLSDGVTNITRSFLCFLIFLGSWSKSAQFGLHQWLLDAMEGPTPVSALLHSATLVTAGIILLCKTYVIWLMSPTLCILLYIIGIITMLTAAISGVFFTDIKRVVAFSTCTHVGLMLFSLGVSGLSFYDSGLSCISISSSHMFVHGWSKSLLFLLCGGLLHQSHCQDIRTLAGFSVRSIPLYGSFLTFSLLSLAGCPGSSISDIKDIILEFGCLCVSGYSLFIFMLIIVSLSQGYSLGIIVHLLFDMGLPTYIYSYFSISCIFLILCLNIIYLPVCFDDLLALGILEPFDRFGLLDIFGLYCTLGLFLGLFSISNNSFSNTLHVGFYLNCVSLITNRLYLDKIFNSVMLWISSFIISRVSYDVEFGFLMTLASPLSGNRLGFISSFIWSGFALVWISVTIFTFLLVL